MIHRVNVRVFPFSLGAARRVFLGLLPHAMNSRLYLGWLGIENLPSSQSRLHQRKSTAMCHPWCHGSLLPFPWFLEQARISELPTGSRTVHRLLNEFLNSFTVCGEQDSCSSCCILCTMWACEPSAKTGINTPSSQSHKKGCRFLGMSSRTRAACKVLIGAIDTFCTVDAMRGDLAPQRAPCARARVSFVAAKGL